MSTIFDIIERLEGLESSRWWMHESKFHDVLGLDKLKLIDQIDSRKKVSKLLRSLEVGYFKDGKDKYGLSHCIPNMSNLSVPNDLNLWYTQYGNMKVLFPSTLHPHSKQRWVAKGDLKSFVDITKQYKLVQYATGQLKLADTDITKRKQLYVGWFRKDRKDYLTYQRYHLPDIYKTFESLFSSSSLYVVGEELRECLIFSNMIPQNLHQQSPQNLQISTHAHSQASCLVLSPPKISRINEAIQSDHHCSTIDKSYLVPIQQFICRFDNSESSLEELSILEFALAHHYYKHYLHQLAIEYATPVKESQNLRIRTLERLSSAQLGYIGSIIKKKRGEYFERFHVLFKIQDNQLLVDWLEQGRRFNDGERLPPSNTEKNSCNGKLCFTDEAMSYVRHMICSFGLSSIRFPSLMNCFSILLLRRTLMDEEFPSITTITSRMLRLGVFDSYIFGEIFRQQITIPSQYGFPTLSYVMTDDTKIDNEQLHAIIKSVIGKNRTKSFRLYSASASSSKDSIGNAQKNYDVITGKESNQVMAHTGGGNSDHENSATKEIDETFLMIMSKLEREGFTQGPFQGNKVYGVSRRVIRNEDWFHSVNLAVMLASVGAFGPTVKDNTQNQHKQVHYRQSIQLFADIMKHCDGQAHMDVVMKDSGHKIMVRRVRERQQRWLVNQQSATWIITVSKKMTKEGLPCLIAWCMRIITYETPSVCDMAKHLLQLLLNKAVWLGLNFDSDMLEYFEPTCNWHSQPGENATRPGFRMLEMHTFLFEFGLPWWEKAKQSPDKVFRKTFQYLKKEFEEQDDPSFGLRLHQIEQGISDGYDQIVKMTSIFFAPPLSFLILTDEMERVPFFRALLKAIMRQDVTLPYKDDDIPDGYDHDGWDALKELLDNNTSLDQLTDNEQKWFDICLLDIEELTHFFFQIGFTQKVVYDDLKQLFESEVPHERNTTNSTPLTEFKSLYPVLFDLLHSTFGLMPSSTRLLEQTHGGNRQALHPGDRYALVDAIRAYSVNEDYEMKEERRIIVRKRKADTALLDTDGSSERKKHSGGVKHDRTKNLQMFQASQLLQLGKRYKTKAIQQLPQAILDRANVRQIKVRGSTYMDKEMKIKRMTRLEEKKSSYRREVLTLDQYKKLAEALSLNNDTTFERVDHGEKEKREMMDKVMGITFWSKVAVNDGYIEKLSKTFPKFWNGDVTSMGKTAMRPLLKKFLDEVMQIVKGDKDHGLGVCVGDLKSIPIENKYDRIALFMECNYLQELFCNISKKKQLHAIARQKLFCCNGTNITARDRYAIYDVIDGNESAMEDDDLDNESDQ